MAFPNASQALLFRTESTSRADELIARFPLSVLNIFANPLTRSKKLVSLTLSDAVLVDEVEDEARISVDGASSLLPNAGEIAAKILARSNTVGGQPSS